jgi:hypothetical protein
VLKELPELSLCKSDGERLAELNTSELGSKET